MMENRIVRLLLVIPCLLLASTVSGQLKPLGAAYYNNEYFMNPAMAGRSGEGNLDFFGSVRKQLTSIPGAPMMQAFSGEYGFTDRVGGGLKVTREVAGLLQLTEIAGTYAYHLPLGANDQRMDFGLSATFTNERLDQQDVVGEEGDGDLYDINNRRAFIDFDYGMAYRSNSLSLEAVVPNIIRLVDKDVKNIADYAVFYASASYRLRTGIGALVPKVAYRGVRNYEDIFDVGLKIQLDSLTSNRLSLFGIYHDTNSATIGFELSISNDLGIAGMYSTSSPEMGKYSNGDFEIGVRLRVAAGSAGK